MDTRLGRIAATALVLVVTTGCAADPTARAPLAARLASVEDALGRGNVGQAVYLWRDAHGQALRSRNWEALAAVAEAGFAIDRAMAPPSTFKPQIRRAYSEALFRALAAGSNEGLLRAAAAFERLGDVDMAEAARAMATPRLVSEHDR